jgi:hypothetical protein
MDYQIVLYVTVGIELFIVCCYLKSRSRNP